MELEWRVSTGNKVTFVTGMHFRDGLYPIRIRRYPANGSMVTDSQRLGVIIGQFIRAQRLCSTLNKFKIAVQNVVLAGMRRGYKRRELGRVWGKFLMQWWKAEEMRRGELQSWFRKMTQYVSKKVRMEFKGLAPGTDHFEDGKKECWHGHRCWFKEQHCPFSHSAPPRDIPNGNQKPRTPWVDTEGETIPKGQGSIWKAVGDGSCMFYCASETNDPAVAMELRTWIAEFVASNWDSVLEDAGITPGELLTSMGWQKDQYLQSITTVNHWGDEWELAFLSRILGKQLRVFREEKDAWVQIAKYGSGENLVRLLFTPENGMQKPHYDMIHLKEAWARERELIEEDNSWRAKHGEQAEERKGPKHIQLENPQEKKLEQMQDRTAQTRKATLWQRRNAQPEGEEICLHLEEGPVEVSQDGVDLLVDLAHEEEDRAGFIGPVRNKRVRHQTRWYQSQEEEEKDRAQRATKDKAGEQAHQPQEQAPSSPLEEESHDWKEGARLGEADHPGPSLQHPSLPQWAQPSMAVPAASPSRPWGHERRKLGLAPPAYQARGVGWPHQKQPPLGTSKKQNSVSSGQRWYTGSTPTHPSTNVACRVTRHDGSHSLTQLPPRSMQSQHAQPHTHANRVQRWAVPCKFGLRCFWKDRFCPFQHPSPMAQAQGGDWAQVQRAVRCWFGNGCTNAFCPFEHSGWVSRKVSKGVNTKRRDWDPYHVAEGGTRREDEDENYFSVLGRGRTNKNGRRLVAAGVTPGEPVPRGWGHSSHFSHFSQREVATRQSTDGRLASRRTLGAEARPQAPREERRSRKGEGKGQGRYPAPGQDRPSHRALKGDHPRMPWGSALAGQDAVDRFLPYPWVKNTTNRAKKGKEKPFSWIEHRMWCEKVWDEGPRINRLRQAAEKIVQIHREWLGKGEQHRLPRFPEGREPRVIAEIYFMYHLP